MSDDRLTFIEEWGKRDPVKWILTEPDGGVTYGRVANGRVVGGKYDGLSVRDGESSSSR